MRNRIKINFFNFISFICVFILTILMPILAFSSDGSVGFSVSPIIPENQIDKEVSYFNLKMKPNEEQDILIEIYNNSNEKSTFDATLSFAKTNKNGIIYYSEKDITLADPTMINPLNTIASLDTNLIEVEANDTVVVPIHIKMPAKEYDGIVLGGISVKKVSNNPEQQDVSITNEFEYVIAIMLSQNSNEVLPVLNFNYVKPTIYNYRNVIAVNIQNPKPMIIRDIEITANVYKEGSEAVLYSLPAKAFKMAPNCNVDIIIESDSKPLELGKYRMTMTAKTKDNVWEWDENFTVEGKDIQTDTNNATAKSNNTIYIIIFVVLFIILLVLFSMLFVLKRRKR